jgi:uncharacterized membrane protein
MYSIFNMYIYIYIQAYVYIYMFIYVPKYLYIIEEPDDAMSAMGLVCALILTIPFIIFGLLNDAFFSNMRDAIEVKEALNKI